MDTESITAAAILEACAGVVTPEWADGVQAYRNDRTGDVVVMVHAEATSDFEEPTPAVQLDLTLCAVERGLEKLGVSIHGYPYPPVTYEVFIDDGCRGVLMGDHAPRAAAVMAAITWLRERKVSND